MSQHYIIKAQGLYQLIVPLYVDDLIYTGNNMELMKEFKEDMMKTFSDEQPWLDELFPRYRGETTKTRYIYLSKEIS